MDNKRWWRREVPEWQAIFPNETCNHVNWHFVPLYDSMRESDAYRALSSRQRALLLECMSEYRGPNYVTDPQEEYPGEKQAQGPDTFFMNWAKAKKIGIHTNRKQFYDDIKALISTGFIEVVSKKPRVKTIYKFSSAWKSYGMEE